MFVALFFVPHSEPIGVLDTLKEMSDRIVFTAVYGPYKPYKKHKQWTGDGKFIINNGTAVLVDEENGKE